MISIRVGRRANMLCPVCGEVSPARQEPKSDTVYVSCIAGSHTRTPCLLPPKEGTVGLEGLIWNQPEALKLFPRTRDDINTLDDQYIKENYWR